MSEEVLKKKVEAASEKNKTDCEKSERKISPIQKSEFGHNFDIKLQRSHFFIDQLQLLSQ